MAWTQIMTLGVFDIYMLYIFTWHTRFYLVVSFKNLDSSHNWVYPRVDFTFETYMDFEFAAVTMGMIAV